MDAHPEAQMRVRGAADVERVGVVEHLRVPRGRAEQCADPLAVRDPESGDFDVGRRGPLEDLQRCVEADQLLDAGV